MKSHHLHEAFQDLPLFPESPFLLFYLFQCLSNALPWSGQTHSMVNSKVGWVWVGGAAYMTVGAIRRPWEACLPRDTPHGCNPPPGLTPLHWLPCWSAKLLRSANVCGVSRASATCPDDTDLCFILMPTPWVSAMSSFLADPSPQSPLGRILTTSHCYQLVSI